MADVREPRLQFSDEEAAFLRHVRFGELPPRVRPSEWVEVVETEPRRDVPEPLGDDYTRQLRLAGG